MKTNKFVWNVFSFKNIKMKKYKFIADEEEIRGQKK